MNLQDHPTFQQLKAVLNPMNQLTKQYFNLINRIYLGRMLDRDTISDVKWEKSETPGKIKLDLWMWLDNLKVAKVEPVLVATQQSVTAMVDVYLVETSETPMKIFD